MCCDFVPRILSLALSMCVKLLLFSFGPDAIVESLISSMLHACAEDSQFTLYCVTEEQLLVGYIFLIV